MEVETLGEMLTIWLGSGARPEAQTQMLMGMGLGPAEWFIRLGESSTFLEVGKNKGNA